MVVATVNTVVFIDPMGVSRHMVRARCAAAFVLWDPPLSVEGGEKAHPDGLGIQGMPKWNSQMLFQRYRVR